MSLYRCVGLLSDFSLFFIMIFSPNLSFFSPLHMALCGSSLSLSLWGYLYLPLIESDDSPIYRSIFSLSFSPFLLLLLCPLAVRHHLFEWLIFYLVILSLRKRRFEDQLGKKVVELTADAAAESGADIWKADVFVCTPEKWDGLSRQWRQRSFVQRVGLIILDEIHLLGQERGKHPSIPSFFLLSFSSTDGRKEDSFLVETRPSIVLQSLSILSRSIFLLMYLSRYLSINRCIQSSLQGHIQFPPVCLSMCLSMYPLSCYLSICNLPVRLSIYLSMAIYLFYLSIHLSIELWRERD